MSQRHRLELVNFDNGDAVFTCSLCNESLPRQRFSRNQIQSRPDGTRRCNACVLAATGGNGGLLANQQQAVGPSYAAANRSRPPSYTDSPVVEPRRLQQQHQHRPRHRHTANDDDDDDRDHVMHDIIREHLRALQREHDIRSRFGQTTEQLQRTQFRYIEMHAASTNSRKKDNTAAVTPDNILSVLFPDNRTSSACTADEFTSERMICGICIEMMNFGSDSPYRVVILPCSHVLCFSCYAGVKLAAAKHTMEHEMFRDVNGGGNDSEDQSFTVVSCTMLCPFCREPAVNVSEVPACFKDLIHAALSANLGAAVASPDSATKNKNNNHATNKTTGKNKKK